MWQVGAFAGATRGRVASAWLVLFCLALSSARIPAQGLWIATQADPPQAAVGERVTLRGYLFSMADGFEDFLFAVDARFLIHHGGGTIVTPNLLRQPEIIHSWEGLLVETNFQVQGADPAHLRVEFVAVLTPYWAQPYYFTNVYPSQIHVLDAVPPRLAIAARPAGMLALTWPESYGGWGLESSPGPGRPWQPVDEPMFVEDDQCAVLVPRLPGPHRLFRLHR